jgi:DNA-directed RNA polymerase specialized sigma24 family protein
MSPSHYAWLRYEDLQQRSKKLQNFDDYAWGIECALNYLLGAIETGTFPSDLAELDAAVNRAIATGARLWRSRALALRTWATPPESSATTAGAADAIIEFARIARTVKKADEEILLDAGHGYTDREIAGRHAATPGAIRVRLSRLRHKLAPKDRLHPANVAA